METPPTCIVVVNNFGPWICGICATLKAYKQLLTIEIVTLLIKLQFASHLGSNRYGCDARRGAADDVVLKPLDSVFR